MKEREEIQRQSIIFGNGGSPFGGIGKRGDDTEKEFVKSMKDNEKVHHPAHYGGKANLYEAIKVIEAWDAGFNLGNTLKYISRAGKKSKNSVEDLEKALWYLQREIDNRKK